MTASLSSRQWAIVGLTVATGIIHLLLGVGIVGGVLNPLFILNGIGYLALIVALYFLPPLAGQRGLVRWVLLGYTVLTFILYFAFNWPNVTAPLGLITKAIELVLIVLLWLDRKS